MDRNNLYYYGSDELMKLNLPTMEEEVLLKENFKYGGGFYISEEFIAINGSSKDMGILIFSLK